MSATDIRRRTRIAATCPKRSKVFNCTCFVSLSRTLLCQTQQVAMAKHQADRIVAVPLRIARLWANVPWPILPHPTALLPAFSRTSHIRLCHPDAPAPVILRNRHIRQAHLLQVLHHVLTLSPSPLPSLVAEDKACSK